MCDTLVALGSATQDGSVILAKNSDREPNEAHILEWHPHMFYEPDDVLRCTYLEIPQVRETFEVVLCKPFWMWGCEMGANEKGVAIGNEAVFTKEPYDKQGLLGMDLMRLALERADTAEKALYVLIDLLERYGQGGAAGYLHKGFMYHNAFMIADRSSAWVLETAGRHWAAERVRDVRSISNRLTIGHDYDLASADLVDHAMAKGWCRSKDDFDFARCYSDRIYSTFSRASSRQGRTTDLLMQAKGQISVSTMMRVLRDHGARQGNKAFSPAGSSMCSVCMHAANELTRSSQSVGSMVAHLGDASPILWVTGTSAPCTSVFKPVSIAGQPLPEHGPLAGATYDPATLWWHHEGLHRKLLGAYTEGMALVGAERDQLEGSFLSAVAAMQGSDPVAWVQFSQQCFDQACQITENWIEEANRSLPKRSSFTPYGLYWRKQARQAQLTGA